MIGSSTRAAASISSNGVCCRVVTQKHINQKRRQTHKTITITADFDHARQKNERVHCGANSCWADNHWAGEPLGRQLSGRQPYWAGNHWAGNHWAGNHWANLEVVSCSNLLRCGQRVLVVNPPCVLERTFQKKCVSVCVHRHEYIYIYILYILVRVYVCICTSACMGVHVRVCIRMRCRRVSG